MVKLTDFFKKKDTCRPEDVEALRQRYGALRSLLEENRKILEIITDLEEKRNEDSLFDIRYLRSNVRRLTEKVHSLIRDFNEISGEGYKTLYPVYNRIQRDLQEILSRRRKIPPDSPGPLLTEIASEKKREKIVPVRHLILDKIVPLNLVDPLDPGFIPENCQTYHDLTRFVHQTATQEMFNLSSKSRVSEAKAIKLDTKIPIEIFLVDLGEAIPPEYRKGKVKIEHIRSWPFQALWKGIESMKWPAPKPMDLKGFASVVAQTATDGSEMIYSDKSFALLSEDYLNFTIRLGYHLSTIEVLGGGNENENFIKFIFKGGGATIERRDRRTRVISRVLEKMGFQVTRKLDFLDAVLPGYPRELMEKVLFVMGKLTLYTKQLDMVMFNDAIVEWSTEEFFKEHIGRELMEELAGSPAYGQRAGKS